MPQAAHRFSLFALLALLPLLTVFGQSADQLKLAFLQAQVRGDYGEAMQIWWQAKEAHPKLLETLSRDDRFFTLDNLAASPFEPDSTAIIRLLQTQLWLSDRQPGARDRWLRERGRTAIAYQSLLSDQLGPILRHSLDRSTSGSMPYLFLRLYSPILSGQLLAGSSSYVRKGAEYAWLEQQYFLYERLDPEQLADSRATLNQLSAALAEQLPGCGEMQEDWDRRYQNRMRSAKTDIGFFTVLRLKGCTAPALSDTLLRGLADKASEPWIMRAMVEAFLDRGQREEAIPLLQKLSEGPDADNVRAVDNLLLADLYRRKREFRKSRDYALEADRLDPEWGRPLIFLADLVLSSGPFCSYTPLQQTALYWLASDYCDQAAGRNPMLKAEVSERLEKYRRKYADEEEVRYYGLRFGDSYAIPCWVEETVRVRW